MCTCFCVRNHRVGGMSDIIIHTRTNRTRMTITHDRSVRTVHLVYVKHVYTYGLWQMALDDIHPRTHIMYVYNATGERRPLGQQTFLFPNFWICQTGRVLLTGRAPRHVGTTLGESSSTAAATFHLPAYLLVAWVACYERSRGVRQPAVSVSHRTLDTTHMPSWY